MLFVQVFRARSSACIDYIIACAGCHAPELIAATKFKTTKINFGGLFGLSTKITHSTVNNEEEEGKGRNVKRPRERLKFLNFPTVVALLSLVHVQWCNAHGANRPDAKRVSNFFNRHEKLVTV